MIGKPAAERFGGDRQSARRLEVGGARAGIATGVVVCEQDGCACVPRCVENDRAQRKAHAAAIAAMTRQVEAIGLAVEMGDPQAFLAQVGLSEAAGEEGPRGGEAIELQRGFGTLIPHGGGRRPRRKRRRREPNRLWPLYSSNMK